MNGFIHIGQITIYVDRLDPIFPVMRHQTLCKNLGHIRTWCISPGRYVCKIRIIQIPLGNILSRPYRLYLVYLTRKICVQAPYHTYPTRKYIS